MGDIAHKDLGVIKSNCKIDGCWEWQGRLDRDGYGVRTSKYGTQRVHRQTFYLYYGYLTPGLQIDHLCRNRSCCNPEHLEEVTVLENIRRGNTGQNYGARDRCKNGHLYTPDNTWMETNNRTPTRRCRTCNRESKQRQRDRAKID